MSYQSEAFRLDEEERILSQLNLTIPSHSWCIRTNKSLIFKATLLRTDDNQKMNSIPVVVKRIFPLTQFLPPVSKFSLLNSSSSNVQSDVLREIRINQILVGKDRVVQMLDSHVDSSDGSAFLILEMCQQNLWQLMKDVTTAIPRCISTINNSNNHCEQFCMLLMFQMSLALSHIHRHCIVHNDIKPSNFLISSKGLLKIGDFGCSFVSQKHPFSSTPSTSGTLEYQSPDRLCGSEPSYKDDLWSLGITFTELLIERHLFASSFQHKRPSSLEILSVHCALLGKSKFAEWVDSRHSDPSIQFLFQAIGPMESFPSLTTLLQSFSLPVIHIVTGLLETVSSKRDDLNTVIKKFKSYFESKGF